MKGYTIREAGDPEGALEFYQEALRVIKPLFSEEPEKEDYQKFISNTIEEIGNSLDELDDEERAKELLEPMKKQLERVVQIFEELMKSGPENKEQLSRFLEVIDNLGVCYQAGDLMDETVKLFDTKIDVYENLFELDPGETDLLDGFDGDIERYGVLFKNSGYMFID